MNKKYTVDDMFNDIDKYSKEKEYENTQRQNEYIKKSTIDQSIVKQSNHLDYKDDLYANYIEPPKKLKEKTVAFKSYFIKAMIATMAIIAFNASHLIFVILLPTIFLTNFICDEESHIWVFSILNVVTITLYMLLFYLPFINYEINIHPIAQTYLNLRFSNNNLSQHQVFLMHQATVLSCILGIYIVIKVFFENTLVRKKPANIMIIKMIIFYLILLTIGAILLFEFLNLATLLSFMQNNLIVAILVLSLTLVTFYVSNFLVNFINEKLNF